jgi:hypothetical protein
LLIDPHPRLLAVQERCDFFLLKMKKLMRTCVEHALQREMHLCSFVKNFGHDGWMWAEVKGRVMRMRRLYN